MNGVTTTTCESMAQKTLLTWMRAKEKRAKISTGRVLDFATKHGSDAEEKLPTMLIRGRRQPSITSSDPDVYIAPGSSTSSAAKISPGFGSNLKRSLQIDMKDLVDDSVACRFGGVRLLSSIMLRTTRVCILSCDASAEPLTIS
ncbi:hypothetical protein F5887DRAFT_1080962 [Amanita rubescens]|nr:hypothetical protein F5887DRAFT_1080962 [Amanita rubescens]